MQFPQPNFYLSVFPSVTLVGTADHERVFGGRKSVRKTECGTQARLAAHVRLLEGYLIATRHVQSKFSWRTTLDHPLAQIIDTIAT